MLSSCSPIRAPRALEPKDSPRSLPFIPASHMPKRQGNSLPFQGPILHIPQTNTHVASNYPNFSQPTLRDVCDPMRRNIVYELEHATRLPYVYEEEDAICSMGRGTAMLPGTPSLSSRHSKVKSPQGSPSTTVHNLNPPPLIRQRVAEYRRRNLVKKLKTPFSHEHGVWDDPPLDFEAVAQAQKRGSPPSKRERAGRLISGLLGRKEARDHRNTYQERGRAREASIDSYFVNGVVEIPIHHRTRSLEMRQQAIELVRTIRRRKLSLPPGQLGAGLYGESSLAGLEPTSCTYHIPLGSDNSNPASRAASLQRFARDEEHVSLSSRYMAVSSPSDRHWAMPGSFRSPSPVEITARDSDSLVSGSDTDDTRSPLVYNSPYPPPLSEKQSHQQPQQLHRQRTTLDIIVESEEGQIILKESYNILCDPPVYTGSDINHSPPANAVTDPVDRVHFPRFHGDNGLDVATAMKTTHTAVSVTPIPQTSSEARIQPPTPTTSVTDTAEKETLTWSHTSPYVSSVTSGTTWSHSITHEHPLSGGECFSERVQALDCHQNYDGDCTIGPELNCFRMGAYLRIPDRAAANDEYHRVKLQRIERLRNTPSRHRNPAYAKFKAEYRLRKQEEQNEERRIRSLAKQNAEAAMFFQVLEAESDLERRHLSSGSRHKSRVYRLPSTI